MLKIFEAIVIFLGGHLLNEIHEKHPGSVNPVDLVLSKSRVIAIFFVAAITGPLLWVSGLILALVGASHWIGEPDASNVFHVYVYFGAGLVAISSAFGAYGLSKKRFEIAPEKEVAPPPPSPTEQIERIIVNVIKEFAKEPKEPKPSTTAATKPPTFISQA